ncbi:ABC transporter ATP-binding protein [Paraconexibacter antarcticus]|uniref:ABC transporter ATP-binding protein n=1 Tax=Paraconexibacter antarcticus TaxID=2949664 RepID=A0ABY5DYU9_9ACTN|nr:ABC transporter ATP-binding protein [Paraconexibacter antarcticus]UTI66047.1 ABC transporter ATP-binding protein [Paraconexibacter antarcticus]
MGGGPNVLEVDGLVVTYGRSVLALSGVSLNVPRGGAVALLGANGAGKTTLLRAVTGLLPLYDAEVRGGTIRFDDRPVIGRDASALVRAGIAQSLEGRRIFPELTVEENLRVGAFAVRDRAAIPARQAELLELFPRLGERLRQPGGLLSGGEQQMLAIARALMAGPELLVLDEPSLGLAPLVVAEIGAALRTVTDRGTAVLLVDQGTALALGVTHDAHLLEHGRIVASGPTTTLLADDRVREAYLGTRAGADVVAAEAGA